MAAELRFCPTCGAQIEWSSPEADPFPCRSCGWSPPAEGFPTVERETENRHNAETLPLPKEQAAMLGLEAESKPEAPAESDAEPEPEAASGPAVPADGPALFRQLTSPTEQMESSDELLEQVPEELRGVLAARMKSTEKPELKSSHDDTVESLKARGDHVTEDARGARTSSGSSRSSDLSPFEVDRMATQQDGDVQPRASVPICPECQAASPAGETRCQWCGADLPQE